MGLTQYGHRWKTSEGQSISDVGGNLLGILNKHGVTWHPMLRSNMRDLHPLWFGIYDNLIYHHGAGFREPLSRRDLPTLRRYRHLVARLLPGSIRTRFDPVERVKRNSTIVADRVYQSIVEDPHFYRYFQTVDAAATDPAAL